MMKQDQQQVMMSSASYINYEPPLELLYHMYEELIMVLYSLFLDHEDLLQLIEKNDDLMQFNFCIFGLY